MKDYFPISTSTNRLLSPLTPTADAPSNASNATMITLADILRDLGIEFRPPGTHHHARDGWIQIDCPFCAPHSHKYHLGIVESGALSNCWRCGPHRTSEALALITGQDEGELFRLLRPLSDLPLLKRIKPKGRLQLPKHGPLLPPHLRYLSGRGFIPDDLSTLWSIKGIGAQSRLSWRILIPILYQGEIVSWTTRSIGGNSARYINAKPEQEKIPAKDILYGLDFCSHVIIVVEGPTDVWRIGPGAAATMGTAYSEPQLDIISRFPVRYICFDREGPAQRRAARIISNIRSFPGETYNIVLDSKDPGEAGRKEVRALRALLK